MSGQPSKKPRGWLGVAVYTALGLGVSFLIWQAVKVAIVVYFLFWMPVINDETIASQFDRSKTGYVVEDGQMAWRPMTGADKLFVNIMSFGQAANSEFVNGRTLADADADSFRVIAGRYGADRTRVWREGRELVGADPATFAVLERGYAYDAFQVWHGETPIMALPAGTAPAIDIHSDYILSVGDATWFASDPAFELPERPNSEPRHHCRRWFEMNGAIWDGATRLYDFDAADPVEVLDCDAGVRMRYEDGVGTEDLAANNGLLIRDGAAIKRLTLLGDVVPMVTLPERITQTTFIGSSFDRDSVFLAQDASGQVYAARLNGSKVVQNLGAFDSLPTEDAALAGRAFWMGGSYFTVVPIDAVTDKHAINQGAATRLGRYAQVDDKLFELEQILARPGDLPVRVVDEDIVLIGSACFDYGQYVTDVSDPLAEDRVITDACDTQWRPEVIDYDGLRIGFSSRLVPAGFSDTDPVMDVLEVGVLTITNQTDAPINLSPEFLSGFELNISGTYINQPDDAWPDGGVQLAANATHRWIYKVNTNADPTYWAWTLKMVHNAKRSEIFGSDPFYIATGQFVGGN